MSHTLARLAGSAALCAALLFAAAAPAAVPAPTSPPDASQSRAAMERAHGRQCAPKRMRGGARSPDFAKCVDALSKLASGRSSSPKRACRLVSHKRKKGRKNSPFERCVKAGAKLVKKAESDADAFVPGESDDVVPGDLDGDGPDADLPLPGDSDLPPVDPADLVDSGDLSPVEPDGA